VRVLDRVRAGTKPEAESRCEKYQGKRIRRRPFRTSALDGYLGWDRARQVWLVEQTTTDADGELLHVEDRYFVANLAWNFLNPAQILRVVRNHWAVENDCFRSFDVQWREDSGAWRTGENAVLALGVLRNGTKQPRPWRDLWDKIDSALRDPPRARGSPTAATATA
jgi:hypothetical protein